MDFDITHILKQQSHLCAFIQYFYISCLSCPSSVFVCVCVCSCAISLIVEYLGYCTLKFLINTIALGGYHINT